MVEGPSEGAEPMPIHMFYWYTRRAFVAMRKRENFFLVDGSNMRRGGCSGVFWWDSGCRAVQYLERCTPAHFWTSKNFWTSKKFERPKVFGRAKFLDVRLFRKFLTSKNFLDAKEILDVQKVLDA